MQAGRVTQQAGRPGQVTEDRDDRGPPPGILAPHPPYVPV